MLKIRSLKEKNKEDVTVYTVLRVEVQL